MTTMSSGATGTPPGSDPASQATPWAQQNTAKRERATARVRKMVEGLPQWEPLPPGEMIVRRPGTAY